jgi:hypothetical protein
LRSNGRLGFSPSEATFLARDSDDSQAEISAVDRRRGDSPEKSCPGYEVLSVVPGPGQTVLSRSARPAAANEEDSRSSLGVKKRPSRALTEVYRDTSLDPIGSALDRRNPSSILWGRQPFGCQRPGGRMSGVRWPVGHGQLLHVDRCIPKLLPHRCMRMQSGEQPRGADLRMPRGDMLRRPALRHEVTGGLVACPGRGVCRGVANRMARDRQALNQPASAP